MIDHNNAIEVEVHKYVTEASTLGLPPGKWPASIPTTIGNGQPFLCVGGPMQDGGRRYRQGNGCVSLTIFND